MNEVALQFETPQQFASFRAFLKERPTAIDKIKLVIYCKSRSEEIEAAIKLFGGKILNKEGLR